MNDNTTDHSPVIIAAAPTGAHKSRQDFPALPVEATQIADEAEACLAAGASMLHLHVRSTDGRHSLDAGLYNDAVEAVRRRCGDALLVQLTSEQAGVYDTAAQIAAIGALEAEFLSIALAEITGDGSPSALEAAARVFADLEQRGTTVQLILYSAEQVRDLAALRERGVLPGGRMPLLFVLGRYHRQQVSTPDDLVPFLQAYDGDDPWMVCAFGPHELDCMRSAAANGGHLRVGFENNTVRADGSTLASTAESVSLARQVLTADGLPVADAGEARRILLR